MAELLDDHRRVLHPARKGVPPAVTLDPLYATAEALQTLVPNGAPSLLHCRSLEVRGMVVFARDVCLTGDVKIVNTLDEVKTVAAGEYADTTVTL